MNQEKQHEALRLADALDGDWTTVKHMCDAAAELRRLHAESEQHLQELRSYRITVENREARIAELEAAQTQRVTPEIEKHVNALTEIARMPNAEHVADAHNNAVRYLRSITQE